MTNKLKNIIPFWRNLISNISEVSLDKIINFNSKFRSDLSIIKNNGTFIDSLDLEDVVIFFNLENKKNLLTIEEDDKINTLLSCELQLDLYGDNSNDVAILINTKLLSENIIQKLIKNKIGLDPNIKISSSYEEMNGIQWLRTVLIINFNYEYKFENKKEVIENINTKIII